MGQETGESLNERVAAQTRWRQATIRNGYSVTLNDSKACRTKGWNQLRTPEAQLEMVEQSATSLRFEATGIQIVPPLCAIDLDVDDAAMIERLWDAACDTFGEDWAADVLVRYGKGAKECWLCRVDEPFRYSSSAEFCRPGEDAGHEIEFFGGELTSTGGAGRQIGASGAHTPGDRAGDPPKVVYRWLDDRDPSNTPIHEMPTVTQDELEAFRERAEAIMADADWQKVAPPQKTRAGPASVVYHLTPDMRVHTDREEWARLGDLGDGDRVRMRELLPPGQGRGGDTARGIVRETAYGPAVFDFKLWVDHMPRAANPRYLPAKTRALHSKLVELGHVERSFDATAAADRLFEVLTQ